MLSDEKIRDVARASLAKYGFEKEAQMVALVSQELRNAFNTFAAANLVVVDLAELEAALKPFAPVEDVEFIPDDRTVVLDVMVDSITYKFPAFKWGDLRRAAALLAALTEETKE